MNLKYTHLVARFLAAGVLLGAPATALAHHSFAMFDQAKDLTLQGSVKELQWTNPHVWLQLQVRQANGVMREWSLEASSPNTLSRRGWSSHAIKAGDKITVRVHPMRDGSTGGSIISIIFTDGRELKAV